MVVAGNKKEAQSPDQPAEQEKEWDNPIEPAKAADERDLEQLRRQKKEAERRKENLSDTTDQKNNGN